MLIYLVNTHPKFERELFEQAKSLVQDLDWYQPIYARALQYNFAKNNFIFKYHH